MNAAAPRSPDPKGSPDLMGQGCPEPIELEGESPGVFAIHGFGGTPQEVALVTEVAAQLGLAARAPLLPGHGGLVSELARHRYQDWFDAVARRYDEFTRDHERVILAGLSLGAVLALELGASRRPSHLILMASAVRLHAPWPDWGLAAVKRLHLPDFNMPKSASDIGDSEARRTNLTYRAQPVYSAIEVREAGRRVLGLAPQIRCPTLIAHGARDHVCPVSNAKLLARRLGSRSCRVVILPNSCHIITRDRDRHLLRAELTDFISTARGRT